MRRHQLFPFVLLALLLFCGSPSFAESNYPARPIHLIVPFSAGGATDALARLLSQHVSVSLGEAVVVDNRPGAGGTLGAKIAAVAAPDGYTLLMGTVATHAMAPGLYKDPHYDPVKDFEPITLAAKGPNVLVINPSLPVSSVKELIALAKARPGDLTFSSAGIGSQAHLSAELFKHMAGIDMLHVPYKGGGPAITALLAGEVSLTFAGPAESLPLVRAGKLRALAVTSVERSQLTPDLPTIAEAGVPGYGLDFWYGAFAPASTPKEIIAKLNTAMNAALRDPEVTKTLHSLGMERVGSTPAEFASYVSAETERWKTLVAKLGIPPE